MRTPSPAPSTTNVNPNTAPRSAQLFGASRAPTRLGGLVPSGGLMAPVNPGTVHPVIAHLAQRFAGWHADYTGDEAGWAAPASSDMALLPVALAALVDAGVLDWSAVDPATGAHWDPFVESYIVFRSRHPSAQPLVQPCSAERWEALTTFLEQFGLVQRA